MGRIHELGLAQYRNHIQRSCHGRACVGASHQWGKASVRRLRTAARVARVGIGIGIAIGIENEMDHAVRTRTRTRTRSRGEAMSSSPWDGLWERATRTSPPRSMGGQDGDLSASPREPKPRVVPEWGGL